MSRQRNCDGIGRRDCLRLGLAGVLGTGLVDLLRMRAEAQPAANAALPATSCILIWMDGGPTHYETFDPKPAAPVEIRGEYEAIKTKVPYTSLLRKTKPRRLDRERILSMSP